MGNKKRKGMTNFSDKKKPETDEESGELELPDEVWVEMSMAFVRKSFEKFKSALQSFDKRLDDNDKTSQEIVDGLDSLNKSVQSLTEVLKRIEEKIGK